MHAPDHAAERPTFVTHLECGMTGARLEADRVHGLSPEGWPILVRYDLDAIKAEVDRDAVRARGGGFWKWRELLPVRKAENVISLGEVDTPLIKLGDNVWTKDEGRLPTGSFKARGLALAVSMAKELGLEHLAMPTAGNAGCALSAYATQAGLKSTVVCPDDTPEINVRSTAIQGAEVLLANGLIHECGAWVRARAEEGRWFDLSTLKEPYRIEGKKTMGMELAAQWGWKLPDVIFYPTGGGTGLIGMWKAFAEMTALGWLEDAKLPKMVAVQSEGCAPIVKAWKDGERHAPEWKDAKTAAMGLRVPKAIGDFLILDAVRESGGWGEAVPEREIFDVRARCAGETGMLLCPEGAACLAAHDRARADGRLAADETAVVFNCGIGLKDPLPPVTARLDLHA
jgi:threonine synthase